MTQPVLADSDVLAVRAGYEAALQQVSPALAEAGCRLFERVSTPQWALEWGLPRWLGEAAGLPPEDTLALVRSNVYGLACVRLQDDLADGEADWGAPALLVSLSALLHQRWLLEYVRLFPSSSPFWGHFERYMAQWLRATLDDSGPPQADFSSYRDEDFLALAGKGAPLKICCAGASLLAGRPEWLPALEDAVDDLLVAAVLLDHAGDWDEDLEAGRYNAFVAYAAPLPQTSAHREANRRRVHEEIYLGEAGAPYFAVAGRYLRRAMASAEQIGCRTLVDYLRWLEAQTAALGGQLAARAGARLRAISNQLLGETTGRER